MDKEYIECRVLMHFFDEMACNAKILCEVKQIEVLKNVC